jgi:hypothetical protein
MFKRLSIALVGLSFVTIIALGLDGSQTNKIISDGNANNVQSIPADLRSQLNTALTTSDDAINAVQRISAEQRNRLKDSFPSGGSEDSALLTDLISYWKLDEASGTRVDSVTATGNDLTDNNTVTSATGKVGDAAHFVNANDEWLSRTSNDSLRCGDIDFTWALWVKLTDKTKTYYILDKRTAGAIEYELYYWQAGDRFSSTCTAGGLNDAILGSPTAGVWYFVVLCHNAAANTWTMQFNDGTANSLDTGGTAPALTTGDFTLGDSSGVAAGNEFQGDIDEVGFWKRVLTAGEITSLYNAGSGVTYPSFAMKDFKKLMYFLVGYKPVKEKHQYKNDFYL